MRSFWIISNYDSCMSHTYACCVSYDSKFYKNYNGGKIFEIRPRKFFKVFFSQNAWAGSKFWLKIRNHHKISRRMIYNDPRLNVPIYEFSCSLRFYAYAISFWLKTSPKTLQNLGSSYIIRRGILCWFQIFSQNFDPAHAFGENNTLKNLRGRISKIFPAL